ncbi:MAG: hypothetical protein H7293_04020, partial [Candidatus Saccharibacteria bacterium]|nr:hypothetical protein [Rhodoferax sp.]
MAALRWIGILVLASIGAYFGFQLTGVWVGVVVGGAAMAFAAYKLFAGEWIFSVITLGVSFAILFQLIGSAPVPEQASAKSAATGLAVGDGSGEKLESGLMARISKE